MEESLHCDVHGERQGKVKIQIHYDRLWGTASDWLLPSLGSMKTEDAGPDCGVFRDKVVGVCIGKGCCRAGWFCTASRHWRG